MPQPNAFDDLPQTSPEMQAINTPAGANAFDDLAPPPVLPKAEVDQSPGTLTHQLTRGLGLSARALMQGAAAIPMMIPDAATSIYDFAKNPHVPSWHELIQMPSNAPSQQLDRALDPYLPTPQTTAEKAMSIPLAMEGGALLPNIPIPGAAAPTGFVSSAAMKSQRLADQLEKTKNAGLVVPPSTTNPTFKNKFLETIGGKEATQNSARAINQNARNDLAANDLGLKPEVFTPDAVAAVKDEAGQAFDAARRIPSVKTDQQYSDALNSVLKESHGSNASFPGSANPNIEKLVNVYRQPEFTGDAAVSAVKLLRGKASDAYRTGNSEEGMAYKGLSAAIESQLERGAQKAGGPYEDLVSSLRAARKTYAQASTIEDAMDAHGNVLGPKLAAAWRRGEPLSGGIKLAAEHAVNYPKANLPANSSNISHLNAYGTPAISLAMEHATGSPLGLMAGAALPASRAAARSYLLSSMGQAGSLPGKTSNAAALARALADPRLLAGGANATPRPRLSIEQPGALVGATNAP